MPALNDATLHSAAADFLYLLDHTYPRSASLQLVGNRHNLDGLHRQVLHRGVFSREASRKRRSRLLSPDRLVGARLLVDGHNVLITVESALAGRPLVAATDGAIRDVAGISHRYHISSVTREAIDSTLLLLQVCPPRETLFLLDAPIRQSGELAALLRTALQKLGLPGGAQTVKVPEADLCAPHAVVATSDSAVLDRAEQAVDLAGAVIRSMRRPLRMIDFTALGD